MSKMKVILLKDVDNIGKKGEVKDIATGYARNFLIPNKMATFASLTSIKEQEEQGELEAKQAEEELVLYQKIASQMDGLEVEVQAKMGKDGKLFGSITASNIIEALNKMGFDLKKEQIKLDKPIKETGEYDVSCELPHGLEATIKVIVSAEAELE